MHKPQTPADSGARRRLANLIGWIGFALSLAIFVAAWLWRHSRGQSWRSAFGFPLDLFVQTTCDFGVPVMVTVVAMQIINRLPPSREKTLLRRIGWGFFVFLFGWWVVLRPALFGWS